MLTNRERFKRVMSFQPVDRLPVIEWAPWWDKTLERFKAEGMPSELSWREAYDYFGLDSFLHYWIRPFDSSMSYPDAGVNLVSSREEYHAIRDKYLYPKDSFDAEELKRHAEQQASGESVIWFTIEGFFWWPRVLLGIEPHLYAFYDQPDLMKEMNEDVLQYNMETLDRICEICTPDFITVAEDMSYNHGPMLSKIQFDEFMAPYYRRLMPFVHEKGIIPLVDSDGDITEPICWFQEVGISGIIPLERMAGVDINKLRADHPRLNMMGGFDKTTMHLGEARMRQEFERIFPTMQSGGYIPSVDHQTPPGVSLEDYRLYIKLLREYCEKAGSL